MVPYAQEAADLLMAYRDGNAELAGEYNQAVLDRLSASHPAYPITALRIRLPLDSKTFDALLHCLRPDWSVRHIVLVQCRGDEVESQTPALFQALAVLPPLLSIRCHLSFQQFMDPYLPVLYRTQHSLALMHFDEDFAAPPNFAAACTHLSELHLATGPESPFPEDVKWHELLVASSNLRVLSIDFACAGMINALKSNTSLFRLCLGPTHAPVCGYRYGSACKIS
jgi:hypothetical protein